MNKKPRIVFAGTVQNCARFLPAVFPNIEKMASLASETAFVFVENDSTDGTKEVLNQWGRGRVNFNLINMDGLNSIPVRTLRLEIARNAYIEFIKTFRDYGEYDLLVIMDMDDDGAHPMELSKLEQAIHFLNEHPERAAIFANQLGKYCDIWALRHAELCPGDAWEELIDYIIKNKVPVEVARAQTFDKRVHCFPPTMAPFEVESAFGGLGIYKLSFIKDNPNPYVGSKVKVVPTDGGLLDIVRQQICEHVHFNKGIRAIGGQLFIMPGLINGDYAEGSFSDVEIPKLYFR
ncbi:MAG: hypothetical protein WCL22_02595 [bacterium]